MRIRSAAIGPGSPIQQLLGLAAVFCFLGCDKPSAPAPSNANTSSTPRRIDQMRSLPYAGDVTDDARGDKSGVVRIDREKMSKGLTLYSVHTHSAAELIDEAGKVLRTWKHEPSRHWDHVDLLDNGDLLVIGADPSDPGVSGIQDEKRYVLRLDWNGAVLWKKYHWAHHDIEQAPNGKLLTLRFERRREPRVSADVDLRDDHLTLLSDKGEIDESLSMYDMISAKPELFPMQDVAPSTVAGKTWIDMFHSNSVEWMVREELFGRHAIFAKDNVLVCFRHQDRVAIFDWSRRELLWAWGQGELSGPHDAQLLENGHILLLDNGLGRDWSRAVELDPVDRKIVWEYRASPPSDFYTKSKGSVQRLANGNTLLCESDRGRILEVTRDGEIVWEFLCTQRNARGQRGTFVRARRYSADFIEAIERRQRRD